MFDCRFDPVAGERDLADLRRRILFPSSEKTHEATGQQQRRQKSEEQNGTNPVDENNPHDRAKATTLGAFCKSPSPLP
jgi:hypothetical protein